MIEVTVLFIILALASLNYVSETVHVSNGKKQI
jgi:hypothetical protein